MLLVEYKMKRAFAYKYEKQNFSPIHKHIILD